MAHEHEECETTWPVCYLELLTDDDTPEQIEIAPVRGPGEVVLVPELHVVGRTRDGSRGGVLFAAYTLISNGGGPTLIRHREDVDAIGPGGLGLTVDVVGSNLVLSLTGLADEDVLWTLYWRHIESAPPPPE